MGGGGLGAASVVTTDAMVSQLSPRAASPGALPVPDRELCFDPHILTGDGVGDVATFIADLRMRAPLSVIRDDLRALLDVIHAELVACVQRDFAGFVGLGPAIGDVDGLADSAMVPTEKLRAELTAIVESLDAEIGTLSTTLEERRRATDRAESLRVLLRANDLLQKCERLLRDYVALSSSSMEALDLLERTAGECAQLSFALSRAGNGKFVRSISMRVSVVRRSLRTSLEAWLRRALFPSSKPSDGSPYDCDILKRVLDAYVVAGISGDAEEFFRREIVAPFASERIRMTPMLAIAEREKGAASGGAAQVKPSPRMDNTFSPSAEVKNVSAADALEVAERIVIQFLGERVMPITSLCESEERLKNRIDFVGKAVWPQVAKAIATHMSSAFSPGTPDVFHQSVLSGTRLYGAVESALVTAAQIDDLRKSQTTSEYWRHWNLPVYFQLRFQEVTSKYDRSLQLGPVSGDGESVGSTSGGGLLRTDMYKVQATVAMVEALRTCWSDQVFLKPLAHRFLRLSLQLLARYVTWVRTGLSGDWSQDTAVPGGAALVHADVSLLQTRLPAEFSSLLRVRKFGIDAEYLERIDQVFADSVASFESLLPDLERSIADSLSQSCVENLLLLRGILATFRMSMRQAPTTHSQLVPKILRPLKAFVREHESHLGETALKRLATSVAEATTKKYLEMATDLLNSNKKSEETLRRLNIGRGGGAGGDSRSGALTDKVSMQLYLDIAKFRDDVEAQGVVVSDVPSMDGLWNLVRRDVDDAPPATDGPSET